MFVLRQNSEALKLALVEIHLYYNDANSKPTDTLTNALLSVQNANYQLNALNNSRMDELNDNLRNDRESYEKYLRYALNERSSYRRFVDICKELDGNRIPTAIRLRQYMDYETRIKENEQLSDDYLQRVQTDTEAVTAQLLYSLEITNRINTIEQWMKEVTNTAWELKSVTTTDADGNYSFSVQAYKRYLLFSHARRIIGNKTNELVWLLDIPVGKTSIITNLNNSNLRMQ